MNPNILAQLQALIQPGQGGQSPKQDPRIAAIARANPQPHVEPGEVQDEEGNRYPSEDQEFEQRFGPLNNDEAMDKGIPMDNGAEERIMSGMGRSAYAKTPSTEEELAMIQSNINKQGKVPESSMEFTGDVEQDRELLMHDPTDDNIDEFISRFGKEELPEELDPENEKNEDDESGGDKQQTKQIRMNKLGRGNA